MRGALAGSCFVLAVLCPASPSWASDLQFKNGRFVLENEDRTARISLGGMVQYDGFWSIDGPSRFVDIGRFRRLRANIAGTFFHDWRFKAEYELTQFSNSLHEFGRGWRSAWVSYRGIPHTEIKVGNQRSPISLENVTASSDTTFLERSSVNAFVSRFYLGGTILTHWHDWTATLGVYRESISSRSTSSNRGATIAARLTWAPLITDSGTVHVGLFGSYESLDAGSDFRISVPPLVDITSHHLVRTGRILGVDSDSLGGLELAGSYGSLLAQGEYLWTKLDEPNLPGPTFDGWYMQASWMLTGEKYRYRPHYGRFAPIVPLSDLGAVELAVRYGSVDLEDQAVTGGVQRDVTLGVNWYLNEYARLGTNYIWASANPNYRGINETLSAVLVRIQLKS